MDTPTILKLVIIYLLAYEDGTECSETSAYKIQTPGNYPEDTHTTKDTVYVVRKLHLHCEFRSICRRASKIYFFTGPRNAVHPLCLGLLVKLAFILKSAIRQMSKVLRKII